MAVTSAGRWSFVSLVDSVAVLRAGGGAVPSLVRTIGVPASGALGEALTSAGRYLVVAGLSGAEVISVARAEQGRPHATAGTLTAPDAMGAIEVALSPGGRYAFVSIEYSHEIAVFSLQRALTRGFGPPDFVGSIPAGQEPVGPGAVTGRPVALCDQRARGRDAAVWRRPGRPWKPGGHRCAAG